MSHIRQVPEDLIAVRSLGLRLPHDHEIEPHAHPWGQVVYATDGVMSVTAEGGVWVVPPQRAAWVPAGIEHCVRMTGSVRMRTVYLRPDLSESLPASCSVLSVSPLLRELILEVLRVGMLRWDVPEQQRLASVLVDRLRVTPEMPLEIALPRDARALCVAQRVLDEPAEPTALEQLADGSGASVRTLERLFVRETGMTFRRWRQQARLWHALRLLAAGESVTSTALSVGFRGTSAFIAMFRRVLGRTPGGYFREA